MEHIEPFYKEAVTQVVRNQLKPDGCGLIRGRQTYIRYSQLEEICSCTLAKMSTPVLEHPGALSLAADQVRGIRCIPSRDIGEMHTVNCIGRIDNALVCVWL